MLHGCHNYPCGHFVYWASLTHANPMGKRGGLQGRATIHGRDNYTHRANLFCSSELYLLHKIYMIEYRSTLLTLVMDVLFQNCK
jgi:hypothetical protein